MVIESRLTEDALQVAVNWSELAACLVFLLLNARTAMNSNGTLAITSSVSKQGNTAVINVSDSGIGMTPEVQGRATELFYTTRASERAAGLGLNVAKDFAEAAQGELRIDSVRGEGTTVSLALPIVS